MGDLRREAEATTPAGDHHHHLLSSTIGDEDLARELKIHSYGKSFNGFAARLLPDEAKILAEREGVVSVFPNRQLKLHTTRSWDFLGMTEDLVKRNAKAESDIIVGVLDTGICLEAPSFSDKGYGPPPKKWKGKCDKGANFTGCNKKVIGARYYNLDHVDTNPTPADTDGHGTHTASTAAGAPVAGASFYGLAAGTARGGVPAARIAVYKVCWPAGCSDMDLLAAFDDAIADGVDVISVSIGGTSRDFFNDPIAIGAFHAMKRGILTSCSAGNEGPSESTVQNVAPWILTVAATSTDRQFRTAIKLGNGERIPGIAVNTFSPKKGMYPLISGAMAANGSGDSYGNVSACDVGSLSEEKVKGRIVYCLGRSGQDYTIRDMGGAGAIMVTDELADIAYTFVLPGASVSIRQGSRIDHYINSTKNAQAVIYKSRTARTPAPFIASFSSRGPQLINRNILKPDVAAPGLDILAAYSTLRSVTGDPGDNRIAKFNIISGTSMACPHVSAAAAYVKTFRPTWSPAAIKSALMTTATPMKIKEPDAELGSGSGQINPVQAVHPGLVYDIPISSYIRFLCKEGYNSTTIRLLTGGKKQFNCSQFKPAWGTDGLNYPTMHLQLTDANSSTYSAVFHRTVTHVETGKSVYKAKVTSPKGLSVTVFPNTLSFDGLNKKRSFKVTVKGTPGSTSGILSALLEWTDSKHSVRSPILIYKITTMA
ncbi:subtilisin-like protease SBT4.15 [Malania oleifera]|uniref:subtilisin-like protease SBT4.15 n=1 Tax=Malania oleifera TaxID=397392 RepID=UPI0025ADC7BA|nr:subtilisin-like protease SBT4.15 [Malania oleifera]